jgi:hypothetical protein
MIKRTPFIKKFKTGNHNYIYDVNSNKLMAVDNILYDIIDEIEDNNITPVIEKFKNKYKADEIIKNYKEQMCTVHDIMTFGLFPANEFSRVLDSFWHLYMTLEAMTILHKPGHELFYNISKKYNVNIYYLLFSEGEMFSTPAGETAKRIEKLSEENGEVKKFLRYFDRSKIFRFRGI